jgi:N6-adenosine-specific RNA methylase IME4
MWIRDITEFADYKLVEPSELASIIGAHTDWRREIDRDKYYLYIQPQDVVYKTPFEDVDQAKAAKSIDLEFPVPGSVILNWSESYAKRVHFLDLPTPEAAPRPVHERAQLPWEEFKYYPVDKLRKWVYDDPMEWPDARKATSKWYPLCELISGENLQPRSELILAGWAIQFGRRDSAIVPEETEQPEAAAENADAEGGDLITGLVEGAYYCVDRLVHTIFNDPMDLSEATAYSPKYYHGCHFIKGKSINGHPRFKGWMIAERNRPPDYMPGSKPKVITTPQKFAAILIDPPWEYTTYSEDTGQGRSAEAHYPTMSAGDIASLPVGDLAADDCALFMWATWPTIQQAFAVGTAWGFEYKTCAFTWAKVKKGLAPDTYLRLNEDSNWHMGMGFWTRANSEVCLLFTKGSPKRQNADVRQLIVASVRKHSQKPDEQYERIERLVKGPYLELFAREKREGWFAWGNEVEPDISFGGIQAAR